MLIIPIVGASTRLPLANRYILFRNFELPRRRRVHPPILSIPPYRPACTPLCAAEILFPRTRNASRRGRLMELFDTE